MAQAGGRLQPRPQNPRGRGKDGGFFLEFYGLVHASVGAVFPGKEELIPRPPLMSLNWE